MGDGDLQTLERNSDCQSVPGESAEAVFRKPQAADGIRVHSLIADNPPLDPNSLYCNLLQCSHFADTCVLVERGAQLLGFMSAYVKPAEPHVLFVWQMAVSNRCRGQGMAGRMLAHLLARPELSAIEFIETTVTPGNAASAKVFKRFAEDRGTAIAKQTLFHRERHFGGHHDDEVLLRIGPFSRSTPPIF